MITIQLAFASDYEHKAYDILFRSVSRHRVTGKGVHNREFNHEVTVWRNRRNPSGEGFVGPDGKVTPDRLSVLLAARATVFTNNGSASGSQGDVLAIGNTVRLVHPYGEPMGDYVITARVMSDPILKPCS